MSDRVSLIETISKNDVFSAFARMLKTSHAEELLSSDRGPFTVFAPTNDAFGKIPDERMNALLSQTGQTGLKALLAYHIVPGKLFAANLEGAGTVKSVSGLDVTFTDRGGLKVNASGLQARNIEAINGVVHGLDTVLTPPARTAAETTAASASKTAEPPVKITPLTSAASASSLMSGDSSKSGIV